MFVGRFDRQLDEKARLVIPAEFVDALQGADREAIYVTPGRDGCLWLVPQSHFEVLSDAVLRAPGATDVLPDQWFHECQRLSVDKAGRVTLDEDARALAAIAAPGGAEPPALVVCGSGRYMQVWDRRTYAENAAARDRLVRLLPRSGSSLPPSTGRPEAGE